jgi:hypothetical protein
MRDVIFTKGNFHEYYINDLYTTHAVVCWVTTETSKADEDRAFPDLQEALALTGMVVEHLASLLRPPPLPAHAPP